MMYRVTYTHDYLPCGDELFMDWEDVEELKAKYEPHGYTVEVNEED